MRILLVIPPLPERTYPGKAMGPDYLAKALLAHGRHVEIFDLDVLGKESLLSGIRDYIPHIVGITNMSIQNDIANDIARDVKECAEELGQAILVIKGGFHELFGHKHTISLHHDYVDYVVVGEGEGTVVRLADAYESGSLQTQRKNLKGLAYYEDNEPHFTGEPIPLSQEDLGELLPSITDPMTFMFSVARKQRKS